MGSVDLAAAAAADFYYMFLAVPFYANLFSTYYITLRGK